MVIFDDFFISSAILHKQIMLHFNLLEFGLKFGLLLKYI